MQKQAMILPDDIESKISAYLNAEFGSLDSESRVKDSDLNYLGQVGDTHYWYFPSTSIQCWATVEPYENSFLISMTTIKPNL